MRNARLMSLRPLALAMCILVIAGLPSIAMGQTTYGTLDNFDVINDTGGDCHGFEIELEDISSSDVAYTFGAPYQRYGDPVIVPTATGVIIRYVATYSGGAWSATTPIAVAPYPPTEGHSCWSGGMGEAAYLASGCDHFGASLNRTPTKTTYHWLVESSPGTLTRFGSSVPLPAPVWNVTPPAVPAGQPIAEVIIEPPAPDLYEFGDALWAKVFTTELPDGLQANDLEHMVADDPDVDIMPEPAEVEMEWYLMQLEQGGVYDEFGGAAEVGAGNEAVSRRFEFYAYTGYYDPESHEARCDDPLDPLQQIPEACGTPDAEGVAGVGALIGVHNVAVNLPGEFVVPEHPPVAGPDSASTDEDVPVTIYLSYLLSNDSDVDPGTVLAITSVQTAAHGTLNLVHDDYVLFTPDLDFNGVGSFTYTVADGHGGTDTGFVEVTIDPVNDAPVANAGPDQIVPLKKPISLDGTASADVDGNPITYAWSFVSRPAHSRAVLSSTTSVTPSFVPDKKGDFVLSLIVSDGVLESVADTVTITGRTGK